MNNIPCAPSREGSGAVTFTDWLRQAFLQMKARKFQEIHKNT
jgi:hypothetical protein